MDEQYQVWLNELAPFLKIGGSLYYAMDRAMLLQHKNVIYQKYRLKDWFREICDAYQLYPGEVVNSIFNRLILSINEKVERSEVVSNEEWRNLRFFADRHRSCRPFFVNRQETVQADPEPDKIGMVIDSLDRKMFETDYVKYADSAKQWMEKMQEDTRIQTAPAPVPSVPGPA